MTPTSRRIPMTLETARLLMLLAWDEALPRLLPHPFGTRDLQPRPEPVVRRNVA